MIEEANEKMPMDEILLLYHMAFMVVGWGFFFSVGSVFARYLKHPPNSLYWWFPFHTAIQVGGMISVLAGFVLAFLHVAGGDDTHFWGLHQLCGLLTVVCAVFIQPAMGIFAHAKFKQTGRSSSFHIAHHWIGRSVMFLAFVTMFLGLWRLYGETNEIQYLPAFGLICLVVLTCAICIHYEIGRHQNRRPLTVGSLNDALEATGPGSIELEGRGSQLDEITLDGDDLSATRPPPSDPLPSLQFATYADVYIFVGYSLAVLAISAIIAVFFITMKLESDE